MNTKGMWIDVDDADCQQPDFVPVSITEYNATGVLPIKELNEIEDSWERVKGEYTEEGEKERFFGESIRSAIKIIKS